MNGARYLGWCGDFNVGFQPGASYEFFNSSPPLPTSLQNANLGAVNWLLNNKPALSGLPAPQQPIQTYIVQQVI